MAVISELIRVESDGTISFGDYSLDKKSKVEDFKYEGDLLKVKTYNEITKLERNGVFVYESVPGTAVNHFDVTENRVEFKVEGLEDAQITLELEPEAEYDISVGETETGRMKTNLGGKLSLSVKLESGNEVPVKVVKA